MQRSFLFVPAKEYMLSKIGTLEADAYIIDLEDSIEDENKEEALVQVESFLNKYCNNSALFVRLNKKTYANEVKKLECFSDLGFMLPKFENVDFYDDFSYIWEKHKVIALIETPLGIVNINEIAKCKWVDMIAFGAEDYTSMVNMENRPELLIYQKNCLVTYAKAYGKYVLDTPCFCIDDKNTIEEDIRMTVKIGFDGKLAITPKHVEVINMIFNNGVNNREEVMQIIEQFEKKGKAVQVINGRVYEKMHIEQIKKQLKQ